MTDSLLRRVEARGLVTEQEVVEWVIGEKPKGTWWSHPRAKEAYQALVQLNDETELLSIKLVDGKQTLVHRKLWPALVRVQQERSLWPALSPAATELFGAVRAKREVQAKGAPRLELERALRVVSTHVHTEKGHHEVVLVPFEDWVSEDVRAAASSLSLETAQAQLRAAGYEPAAPRSAKKKPSAPRPARGDRKTQSKRSPR